MLYIKKKGPFELVLLVGKTRSRDITITLPETNIFAPENGWLEYDPFLLGFGLFSGASC